MWQLISYSVYLYIVVACVGVVVIVYLFFKISCTLCFGSCFRRSPNVLHCHRFGRLSMYAALSSLSSSSYSVTASTSLLVT